MAVSGGGVVKRMPVSLLEDDADWVEMYRSPEEEPEPEIIPGKEVDNSWGGIYAAAKLAGAKFLSAWRRSGRSVRLDWHQWGK